MTFTALMPEITLKRGVSTPTGTYGSLIDEDQQHICFTLEKPWLDNAPQSSSIPTGKYECVAFNSPTKGAVYLLKNVPNRSMIEIHKANVYTELLGCIAVGTEFGMFDVDYADDLPAHSGLAATHRIKGVLNSGQALGELKLKLNYPQSFWLNVI